MNDTTQAYWLLFRSICYFCVLLKTIVTTCPTNRMPLNINKYNWYSGATHRASAFCFGWISDLIKSNVYIHLWQMVIRQAMHSRLRTCVVWSAAQSLIQRFICSRCCLPHLIISRIIEQNDWQYSVEVYSTPTGIVGITVRRLRPLSSISFKWWLIFVVKLPVSSQVLKWLWMEVWA